MRFLLLSTLRLRAERMPQRALFNCKNIIQMHSSWVPHAIPRERHEASKPIPPNANPSNYHPERPVLLLRPHPLTSHNPSVSTSASRSSTSSQNQTATHTALGYQKNPEESPPPSQEPRNYHPNTQSPTRFRLSWCRN